MPDFDPVREAARNWAGHWGDDPVPSMAAVTSIMRVQQILLARLNDTLKPYDLTFPRYEALMLLFYSRRGEGPFYCWRYEEGLGQWRSARVLSYHLPLKELCTTSWKALPSALQARLDEYYIE